MEYFQLTQCMQTTDTCPHTHLGDPRPASESRPVLRSLAAGGVGGAAASAGPPAGRTLAALGPLPRGPGSPSPLPRPQGGRPPPPRPLLLTPLGIGLPPAPPPVRGLRRHRPNLTRTGSCVAPASGSPSGCVRGERCQLRASRPIRMQHEGFQRRRRSPAPKPGTPPHCHVRRRIARGVRASLGQSGAAQLRPPKVAASPHPRKPREKATSHKSRKRKFSPGSQ